MKNVPNMFVFQCRVVVHKAVTWMLFALGFKSLFVARYPYNFSAQQLRFLCECLDEVENVAGDIAEVGCEKGSTTLFLCNYLDTNNSRKRYFAVDTFNGFVDSDIDFEVQNRNKEAWMYSAYQVNSSIWFERSMREHGHTRVATIKGDINDYSFPSGQKFAFVILDVDLYKPVAKALPELFEALSPGGIIIVDDCNPHSFWWDGAHQAFDEFTSRLNLPKDIIYEKIGVIRKPLVAGT